MEQRITPSKREEESLTLNPKKHRHIFIKQNNFLICKCGKKILALQNSKREGLLIGRKSDGRLYRVRTDRRRYFFPDEWTNFIKLVTTRGHKFFFLTSLHTGGRIMEILNLRYKDIDEERGTITFNVVKQRKAKRDFYATGKNRAFFVSSEFLKEY